MNRTKKIKIVISIIVVSIIMISVIPCFAATATPTLVTRLTSIFKRIKEYLVKLAGPIAAVSIITGVMIRKLSFGDEEKMVIGKRVIINAIFCYFIVLLVDLIIKFIEALV